PSSQTAIGAGKAPASNAMSVARTNAQEGVDNASTDAIGLPSEAPPNPFQAVLDAMADAERRAQLTVPQTAPADATEQAITTITKNGQPEIAPLVPSARRLANGAEHQLLNSAAKADVPKPGEPGFVGPLQGQIRTLNENAALAHPANRPGLASRIDVHASLAEAEPTLKMADRLGSTPTPSLLTPTNALAGGSSVGLETTNSSPFTAGATNILAPGSLNLTTLDGSINTAASTADIAAARAGGTPTSTPSITHQLVQGIRLSSTDRTIEMQLDPPHLGRVRIEFDFSGENIVKAIVSAADPETTSLLRRQSGSLSQELADAGLEDVTIEFADHLAQEDGGGETPLSGDITMAIEQETEPTSGAPQTVATTTLNTSGLDIRL
ncbi:MAG: flagellar hook-length control protein FliK, partial [Pseudomonadota bacterium]